MAQTSLEIEIARIQQARLALQAEEEKIRKQYKNELLKNRASDKVIARVLKTLKDNEVTKKQLLTALDNDSVYGNGKVTTEAGAIAEATDADVNAQSNAPQTTIGVTDKRQKVLPKYQNPFNLAEKWSGRGIPPSWAKKLKDANMLDSARITKSSDA